MFDVSLTFICACKNNGLAIFISHPKRISLAFVIRSLCICWFAIFQILLP
jgi:hypothetical protein